MFYYEVCNHQIFYITNKFKLESCEFQIRLNSDLPNMFTAIFHLIIDLYKF